MSPFLRLRRQLARRALWAPRATLSELADVMRVDYAVVVVVVVVVHARREKEQGGREICRCCSALCRQSYIGTETQDSQVRTRFLSGVMEPLSSCCDNCAAAAVTSSSSD